MRYLALYPISALIVVISASCAVKESPAGGPEDREAPGIVRVDPEPGSTEIPLDTRFSVTFSKPMDRTRTESSVFLSPVFWDYPRMKWSAKRLTITPPEPLRPGRTYVLTVGADGQGYHGNRIGKSQSFAFSTGPVIDSGSIGGAVYSEEAGRMNYDIWAYVVPDSVDLEFLTRIPDYATQVDSLGGFTISNVSPGLYVVVAVDDKNDDLFWEPSSEPVGLPPFVLVISGNDAVDGLILRPERRDTTLAYLSRVKPVDNRKLEIEFSQTVDDNVALRKESYRIESLDYADTLDVLGVYKSDQGRLIIETGLQHRNRRYRIFPVDLVSLWGIGFDTAGVAFEGSAVSDSLGPGLIAVFPPGDSRDVYQDSVIELTFSERINPLNFSRAVTVVVDSLDTLQFAPGWIDPNKVRLRFSAGLPRQKTIEVTLIPDPIVDAVGNPMTDSAAVFSFIIPPPDTVGSVIAAVENAGQAPTIGVLTAMNRSGRVYESRGDIAGAVTFEAVLPGSYRFQFFEDSDDNGRWSAGVLEPFRPAERFSFLADSVVVRSRWTTDIGSLRLPDAGGKKD